MLVLVLALVPVPYQPLYRSWLGVALVPFIGAFSRLPAPDRGVIGKSDTFWDCDHRSLVGWRRLIDDSLYMTCIT